MFVVGQSLPLLSEDKRNLYLVSKQEIFLLLYKGIISGFILFITKCSKSVGCSCLMDDGILAGTVVHS